MKKKAILLLTLCISIVSGLLAQSKPGSGNSLQFNGFSSYVNCGTNDRNITNQLTVEAWIKTTSSALQMICTKYDNPGDEGFQLLTQNGYAALNGRDNVGFYKSSGFSSTLINDGKWHHVVGVCNVKTWEIWVDGQLENSNTYTASNSLSNTTPLAIGVYFLHNDLFFNGEIDEVRIWNKARNSQEIRDNMCRKLNLTVSNLVSYYKLDEGSGTTTTDNSPLNLNGTLVNLTNAWQTSGAAIGDISTNLYALNWANAKVKLAGIHNDTLLVENISNNATGLHIYRVNGFPNTQAPPPNAAPTAYFGVFSAGQNVGYTLGYKPATITCSADSAILSKRADNSVINGTPNWLVSGMSLNTANTYFIKTGEIYRGEYYVEPFNNAQTKVKISGNLVICPGTSTTLTATPSGSFLWNNGQTTAAINVTAAGKYYVSATNSLGCTTSDTVFVTEKPAPIANAGNDQAICSGASTTIGTTSTAGYTYSWSPATGLSNAAIADPTLTLTNNTTNPITRTYTVTTTLNGCSTTDEIVVTVNPLPVVVPGQWLSLSGCPDKPKLMGPQAVSGYSYSWSPATGLSSTTIANPVLTLSNPSTSSSRNQDYTLTITNTSGCSVSNLVRTSIIPTPIVNAGTDKAICSGGTTTIGTTPNTNHSYSWSPATGLSNTTISNPIVTLFNTSQSPINQVYILTSTKDGCSYSDTVIVTVNPLPVANAGTDKTICSNGSAAIGVSAVTGNTYSWSPAVGLSSTTISNPIVTLTNNTTAPIVHTYLLTVTNGFNCSDTASVRITVNPLPISNAGADAVICSGDSTTIGGAFTTGYTYSWSPAVGLSDISTSNPIVSLTNNTNTPITQVYTVTSTYYGCVTSDQITVTVNPAIVLDAGTDKVICADETIIIGTPALPGYNYKWAPATGLTNLTAATPIFTGLNSGTVPLPVKLYLTVTSTATNCSLTDSVTVTVNPRPSMDSIAGSPSVCPGVVGVRYNIKNPRLAVYQWLVEGGAIASGQGTTGITVDWGPSGNGKVKAFTINTFSCSSDTIIFDVIINPLLITQKPDGPQQLCFYEARNIHYQTPLTTNGSFYTYQAFGGTITSPNPSSAGIFVNWHALGIGKLVVTETSTTNLAHCFGVSDTLYITINPSPDTTLTISGPASACALTQQISYSLSGGPGSSYQWRFNGNILPDTDNQIFIDLGGAGTYTLEVIELNSFGCPGRKISKTISATPLPGTLVIFGPTIICPDNQSNISYAVTGLPGSTFSWRIIGGTITSGNGSNTIYVDFDTTVNKRIEVTETSSGNCIGLPFSLLPKLDASEIMFELASVSEANDQEVILNLNLLNAGVNTKAIDIYRRENGTAAFQKIASIPNSEKVYVDANLQTSQKVYEYRLESQNECGTEFRRTTAHNTIKLEATGNETAKSVTLSWNKYRGWGKDGISTYEIYGKTDNSSYQKLRDVNASDSTATLAGISSQGFNQCYRIKAIGKNGLVSWSNNSCLTFENEVVVYNILTANSDNKNDFFTVENIHLYPGNEVTIFNRWGKEIFRQKDYQNDWSGKDISAGTYYYLLKLKNGRSFKGWLEIVKD